jgi:CBS domain containing-hemolysin-like protein
MFLLITFVLIALVFSFLCSIAEAVILSVTPASIALLEKDGKPSGALLAKLKAELNRPLAAILTLNTIAGIDCQDSGACAATRGVEWPPDARSSRTARGNVQLELYVVKGFRTSRVRI